MHVDQLNSMNTMSAKLWLVKTDKTVAPLAATQDAAANCAMLFALETKTLIPLTAHYSKRQR